MLHSSLNLCSLSGCYIQGFTSPSPYAYFQQLLTTVFLETVLWREIDLCERMWPELAPRLLNLIELILKLIIKRNDWLLADTCPRTHVRKQQVLALYFEFETVLRFYNLRTWAQMHAPSFAVCRTCS